MAEQPDARALRRMAMELAADETPELDWERLETQLMSRLDEGPRMSAEETARLVAASPDEDLEANERESLLDLPDRESLSPAANLSAAMPPAATIPPTRGRDSVPAPRVAARSTAPAAASAGTGDHIALTKPVDPSPSPWRRSLVLVAVAAALVLGVGIARLRDGGSTGTPEIAAERWLDPETVPMAEGLPGVRNIDALRAGDVVEAAAGSLSFGRAGLVVSLAAGSRVKVVAQADGRRIFVLDHGSLETTLSEEAAASPLLIGAGDTRVTADGVGSFVITRSSRGLMVEVAHGQVAVSGFDGSSSRLLRAPAKASVSLDGAREVHAVVSDARDDNAAEMPVTLPVAPERTPRPAPRLQDASPTDAVATAAPTSAPAEAAPVETTRPAAAAPDGGVVSESSLRGPLSGCFRGVEAARRELATKNGAINDDVKTTIRSTLELRVGASGLVESGKFTPPLRADLQACAVPLMRSNVGGAARTIRIPVDITH